ncbi:hypothetical protein BV898_19039 [Hypsibius exemplaris]|uniref:Uncharacterized protein n=1 Tax=Hypsibius exemplaris TaxID=2072580 RepID=A0A9X6NIL0_HYPEX|nr:hypothetical protein BV898_19039 [Hypsibius exemplaris]
MVLFFVANVVYSAPSGTGCGPGRSVSGGAGDNMDAKVQGCPNKQSWEACCAACGSALQSSNSIKSGWHCEKDFFSTGIWLKGCQKTKTCGI